MSTDRSLARALLALQIGGSLLLAAIGFALGALHSALLRELERQRFHVATPGWLVVVWIGYLVLVLIFAFVAFPSRPQGAFPISPPAASAQDADPPSPYLDHPGPVSYDRPARPAPLAPEPR